MNKNISIINLINSKQSLVYSCIYIFFDMLYYFFICNFIRIFNSNSLGNSALILFIFSTIINLPLLILINLLSKKRLKFFMISTIYILIVNTLFFLFGKNILSIFNLSSGTINFTIYIYKYLFMFSPFLSLFFLSMHKIYEQKKQLVSLIAFKKILPLIISLIMCFINFTTILWTLAILDLFTSISSVILANKMYK